MINQEEHAYFPLCAKSHFFTTSQSFVLPRHGLWLAWILSVHGIHGLQSTDKTCKRSYILWNAIKQLCQVWRSIPAAPEREQSQIKTQSKQGDGPHVSSDPALPPSSHTRRHPPGPLVIYQSYMQAACRCRDDSPHRSVGLASKMLMVSGGQPWCRAAWRAASLKRHCTE